MHNWLSPVPAAAQLYKLVDSVSFSLSPWADGLLYGLGFSLCLLFLFVTLNYTHSNTQNTIAVWWFIWSYNHCFTYILLNKSLVNIITICCTLLSVLPLSQGVALSIFHRYCWPPHTFHLHSWTICVFWLSLLLGLPPYQIVTTAQTCEFFFFVKLFWWCWFPIGHTSLLLLELGAVQIMSAETFYWDKLYCF